MSFTLGGKRPEDFNLVLLKGQDHPALPRTEDRIQAIPGRHGAWDFGAEMRTRDFSLPLEFIGLASAAALQAKVREFVEHLLGDDGRPRTLELIFDTEPDVRYWVRYSGRMRLTRMVEGGRFTLPLTAVDPWAEDVEEQVVDKEITTSPDTLTVVNGGTVETPAVIVIRNTGTADITNIKITSTREV